jgi:hypothetical protein
MQLQVSSVSTLGEDHTTRGTGAGILVLFLDLGSGYIGGSARPIGEIYTKLYTSDIF